MTATTPSDPDTLVATARHATDRRPLGALDRARRSGAAARACPGWVWPHWWDRQRRPSHPAFVASGSLGLLDNVTGRTWTTVGTASGAVAVVDPAGCVVPAGGGWSLDWAVRAEDRWHVAAREGALRQRRGPVVETRVRVPGGDIREVVYAIPGDRRSGDLVVVELHNDSPVPVAVALAVRPADVLGAGVVSSLALRDDGFSVDDRPVVRFDRAPVAHAVSSGAAGDSWTTVLADAATSDSATSVRCPWGLAQGAAVFPLPHTAVVRVVLAPAATRRAEGGRFTDSVDPAAIERGWARHVERGMTLELPEPSLNTAHAAATRRLLLALEGSQVGLPLGATTWGVAEETAVVRSLARAGFGRDVAPVLIAGCDEQRVGSWLRREPSTLAALVPVLEAVVAHWHAQRDPTAARAVLGSTVKALQWALRRRERGEGADGATGARLLAAATALPDIARGIDLPDTADDLDAFVDVVAATVAGDLNGTVAGDLNGTVAGDLNGTVASDLNGTVARDLDDDAVALPSDADGDDLGAAAHAAASAIAAGDPRGVELLAAVLGANADGPWPTRRHPRTGAGCAGAGDDPRVAAAVLEALRTCAVDERAPASDGTVALCLVPVMAPSWLGRPIDVRDVPTAAGALSFSLRWHGARPALLWEVAGEREVPVVVTSGIDPTWSSTARRGEALLAAPPAPAAARADGAAAEPAVAVAAEDARAGEGTPVALARPVARPAPSPLPGTTERPASGPAGSPPAEGESFG